MSKQSSFGHDLIQAMGQALAHATGAQEGAVEHRVDVEAVNAREVRKHLKLTQDQMAAFLGTSVSGYRKWEQGQRQPSGAARTLLRVMEKEPQAVLRALSVA